MGTFTFNLQGVATLGTSINTSLYSNTKDENLTYTGSDTIVWDRLNSERLRRGLSSLTNIGYPRPPEESGTTTANGSAPTFDVKGPPGLTFEQAKAIFDQQNKTGSLVGFKPGDVLSAATQAADGLAAAQSQLAQAASGSLPAGINLNSITAGIGAQGQGAAAQVQLALAGGAAAFNSLTTGASAATASISSALNSAGKGIGSLGSSLAGISSVLPAVTGALTGTAATVGSLANNAVKTVSSAIGGIPSVPINVADFATQGAALAPIAGLKLPDVTGVLAQAKNLVGQASNTISNALGAGKFGFDASQLERAGLVKPGTVAAFLALGNKDIVSVLKSPTVWTGKEGAKSLDGLLNNPRLQDKVQQGLMGAGLSELESVGVPVDLMKPQALAGLAMNAAKSVQKTVDWVKDAPGLPADIKTQFNTAAASGAFAVNLTETKVEPVVKQEVIVEPASNTVNNDTQVAASKRIVDNDKIPTTAVTSSPRTAVKSLIDTWFDFLTISVAQVMSLKENAELLINQASITQEQWNKLNEQSQLIRATYNARAPDLQINAVEAINNLSPSDRRTLSEYFTGTQSVSRKAIAFFTATRTLIKELANKIAT